MTKKNRLAFFIAICYVIFSVPSFAQQNRYHSDILNMLQKIDEEIVDNIPLRDSLLREASYIAQEHCSDSVNAAIFLRMVYNFKRTAQTDSALLYLNRALSILPEEEQVFAIKSEVMKSYSDLKNDLGETDSVKYFLDESIKYANIVGDSTLIIGNLADLARFYSNTNKTAEAIKLLQIIEDYQIRTHNYFYLKHLYNQLGVCYFRINMPDAANEMLHKGLKVEAENGDKMDMYCYNNLGQLHSALLNQQDSAIYYYKKSRALAEKYSHPYSWLVSMLNIGNCHEALKEYREAEKIYLTVLRSDNISSFHNVKTASTINLGVVYYNINEYKKALFYIEEGIMLAREGKYLNYEINALKYKVLLSSFYKNHSQFVDEFDLFFQLLDSSYQLSQNAEISELKVQYETEKAEQENENLKEQDELNKEMIKKQRTMLWIMICSIIVLISLLIFIFNLNKKQKKLAENLHQSNITKDKLFSIIGHDLKSPMSSILTTLTILDDDNFDLEKDQFKDIVGELKLNVENSTMLLSNLLQWSQNQRQGIQNNPGTTNLETEIQQVISFLKNKIQEKELHLECKINKDQNVWCDSQLLSNTLLNIINNAIKFTDPKGNISVDATVENEMVRICISDDGVGIPLEHQDKLFRIETGYHTDGTANEKGTGLGLAMCKEYVNAMGGEISVKSMPGEGSVFCFTIPAMKNA